MDTMIKLGEIVVHVVKKDIKNLHLSVYPPTGSVRISAPLRTKLDAIRIFVISKLDWIKRQRNKQLDQERESPREYLDRESHYLWGKRYLLKVIEEDSFPKVELKHRQIYLRVCGGASEEKKRSIIEDWYRVQLKKVVPSFISKWELLMGVKVERFFIQKMKTKWGSCNPRSKNIRLNSELAKKPQEYLEYIIVHEMTHLLEPTHNHRFTALIDQFLPKWSFYREELNRSQLSYEQWKY